MAIPISRTLFEKINSEWKYEPKCHYHGHCIHEKPFVDTPLLEKWMNLTTQQGKTHFETIIEELTPDDWPQFHDVNALLIGENRCVLVLSILQKRSRGHLILHFSGPLGAGVTDASLKDRTLDINRLKQALRQSHVEDIETIVEQFEEDSWEFCLPKVDSATFHHAPKFDAKARLPFCQIKRLSEGGQATLFEVKVPENFVADELRSDLGKPSEHRPYGQCYDLAIKSYSADSKDMFDAEVNAFRGIAKRPGFVLHFGHYTHQHGEPGNSYDHHILLEKGSCDLIEYFYTRHPPESSAEICSFWRSICDVAESVREIQQLHHHDQAYLGWHGDVKPSNILLVNGEWKLADFGFTTFKRVDENLDSAEADLDGVTRSYGPPEWRSSRDAPKTHLQAIDNWALGCVLSVTATWVVLGYKGVEDFQYLRERRKDDDAFHKDGEVLPLIPLWFRYLREVSRRSDEITPNLLKLIETGMLQKKPMDRMPLTEICESFRALLPDSALEDQMLAGSQGDTQDAERETEQEILAALVEMDVGRRNVQFRDRTDDEHPPRDKMENLLISGAGGKGRSSSLMANVPKPVSTSRRALHSTLEPIEDPVSRRMSRTTTSEARRQRTQMSQVEEAEVKPEIRPSHGSQSPVDHTLSHQSSRSKSNEIQSLSEKDTVNRSNIFELARHDSPENMKRSNWILDSFPEVVHDQNEHGCTPIMVAASCNNTALVELLLGSSRLDKRDNEQKIVLHHAVYSISRQSDPAPDTRVIELILGHVVQSGFDMEKFVNIADCGQHTPLWFCVNQGSRDAALTARAMKAAQLLLDNGAHVHSSQSQFRNVLEHAAEEDDLAMTRLLLGTGERFQISEWLDPVLSNRIRQLLIEKGVTLRGGHEGSSRRWMSLGKISNFILRRARKVGIE